MLTHDVLINILHINMNRLCLEQSHLVTVSNTKPFTLHFFFVSFFLFLFFFVTFSQIRKLSPAGTTIFTSHPSRSPQFALLLCSTVFSSSNNWSSFLLSLVKPVLLPLHTNSCCSKYDNVNVNGAWLLIRF